MAIRNDNLAPLTLDSFRLFFDFLPTALKSMHEYRFGLTPYFFEDWKRARHWKNDEITPFELMRTLDPKPVKRDLKNAWANTVKAYPGFAKLKSVQSWAGLIDATPIVDPAPFRLDRFRG